MALSGSFSVLVPTAWTSAVWRRPHLQKPCGSMAHRRVNEDVGGRRWPSLLFTKYSRLCFWCSFLPGSLSFIWLMALWCTGFATQLSWSPAVIDGTSTSLYLDNRLRMWIGRRQEVCLVPVLSMHMHILTLSDCLWAGWGKRGKLGVEAVAD